MYKNTDLTFALSLRKMTSDAHLTRSLFMTASIFFEIKFAYNTVYVSPMDGKKIYSHFENNYVGREGRTPFGGGPCCKPSQFTLDELPEVVRILTEQMGSTPEITLLPYHRE